MSGAPQRRSQTAPTPAAASGTGGGGAATGSGSHHGRTGSGSLARMGTLGRASTLGHSRTSSMALPSPPSALPSPLSADDATYAAAQELASVMNMPTAPGGSWLGAWPWATALYSEDYAAPPPPLPPGTLPEVCRGGVAVGARRAQAVASSGPSACPRPA